MDCDAVVGGNDEKPCVECAVVERAKADAVSGIHAQRFVARPRDDVGGDEQRRNRQRANRALETVARQDDGAEEVLIDAHPEERLFVEARSAGVSCCCRTTDAEMQNRNYARNKCWSLTLSAPRLCHVSFTRGSPGRKLDFCQSPGGSMANARWFERMLPSTFAIALPTSPSRT